MSWSPNVVTLAEVGVTVIDCDHRTPVAVDEGMPYVTIPQMKAGRLDLASARKISDADFEEWTKKALPKRGDLVVSRRCNPGESAWVSESGTFALGQNLILLRTNPNKLRPGFLRYLAKSNEWWNQVDKHLNVGAVFNSLRLGDIPKFTFDIPPIPIQDRIAAILGSLDDKIELNRRMNETLEAMARAIFKSWFVDFDPVRVKARGGDPTAEVGLSPEIAALFPDSFQDSELGSVPSGWRVNNVSDWGKVVCGKTPSTKVKENFGKDIPFITIPDMHGTVVATKTKRHLSLLGADSQKKQYLPVGAVCVSCIATPGLVCITSELSQTNQQINSVIPIRAATSPYLYFSLSNLGLQIGTDGGGGSVYANLSTSRFASLKLLDPPDELLGHFELATDPILQRIKHNDIEARLLTETRDYLLPRLLSGLIQLGDL